MSSHISLVICWLAIWSYFEHTSGLETISIHPTYIRLSFAPRTYFTMFHTLRL
jgi:hypothetical protein